MTVERAALIAKLAHQGQKYGEHDYYEGHVLQVLKGLVYWQYHDAVLQQVALLHDVLEDTFLTEFDLLKLGIDGEVVLHVLRLTRKVDETYEQYIDRVAGHDVTRRVKIADLEVNIAAGTGKKQYKKLVARYEKALKQLTAKEQDRWR